MAKQSVNASAEHGNNTAKTKHYPNSKHPDEVDPQDCPDVYASFARGDCLAPVFLDNECFVFSKSDQPMEGDYVGIWLRPDIPHAHELPRRVKRLRSNPGLKFPVCFARESNAMPMIELEQFNPPRILIVPADHILAMHKVIGTAITNGDGTAQMIPLDLEKLDGPCLVERLSA